MEVTPVSRRTEQDAEEGSVQKIIISDIYIQSDLGH